MTGSTLFKLVWPIAFLLMSLCSCDGSDNSNGRQVINEARRGSDSSNNTGTDSNSDGDTGEEDSDDSEDGDSGGGDDEGDGSITLMGEGYLGGATQISASENYRLLFTVSEPVVVEPSISSGASYELRSRLDF